MIGRYLILKNEIQDKIIYIWGAGNNGKTLLKALKEADIDVEGFIDSNKLLQGNLVDSLQVLSIDDIKINSFIIVSTLNSDISQEISEQLTNLNFKEGKDYILWTKFKNVKLPDFEKQEKLIELSAMQKGGVAKENNLYHDLGEKRFSNLYLELEKMYERYVFQNVTFNTDDVTTKLVYNLIGTNDGESIYIRKYLKDSLQYEGCVCEFGIAQGATSALIANEIKDTNKQLYLFDSFEGLSVPTKKDKLKDDIFNLGDISKYAYTMKSSINEVKGRLKDINFDEKRVTIIPGFIEESIKKYTFPKNVCFAYVDFDLYEPILIALEYLHTTLAVGGAIVVDDYDFFSTGAKTAVDEFVAKYANEYNLILPIKEAGCFCVIERKKQ